MRRTNLPLAVKFVSESQAVKFVSRVTEYVLSPATFPPSPGTMPTIFYINCGFFYQSVRITNCLKGSHYEIGLLTLVWKCGECFWAPVGARVPHPGQLPKGKYIRIYIFSHETPSTLELRFHLFPRGDESQTHHYPGIRPMCLCILCLIYYFTISAVLIFFRGHHLIIFGQCGNLESQIEDWLHWLLEA